MTKTALSLLFCATLLAACAAPLPEVRIERVTIPLGLLSCAPAPELLHGEITQRDVALYIIDLRHHGQSCEAQLQAVKALQDRLIESPDQR